MQGRMICPKGTKSWKVEKIYGKFMNQCKSIGNTGISLLGK